MTSYIKKLSLPDNLARRLRVWISDLRSSCEGVSAIEFALITPVMLIFFVGVTDFGLAMFHKMELQSAVRAGAQYALGNSTDTAAIISNVVNSTNSGISSSDVTLTCKCLNTSTEASTGTTTCGATSCSSNEAVLMTIGATYAYTPLLAPRVDTSSGSVTRFLGFIPSSFNLSGAVTVRIK